MKGGRFIWQVTFREALYFFRNAVLRYAVKLRQLHSTRIYTNLTNRAPQSAYDKYPEVIQIQPTGAHKLTNRQFSKRHRHGDQRREHRHRQPRTTSTKPAKQKKMIREKTRTPPPHVYNTCGGRPGAAGSRGGGFRLGVGRQQPSNPCAHGCRPEALPVPNLGRVRRGHPAPLMTYTCISTCSCMTSHPRQDMHRQKEIGTDAIYAWLGVRSPAPRPSDW